MVFLWARIRVGVFVPTTILRGIRVGVFVPQPPPESGRPETFVFPFPFSSTLAVKIVPKDGSGTMGI